MGMKAVVREALIRARYPQGGYPDPINPQEDTNDYDAMAAAVVHDLIFGGYAVTFHDDRDGRG